MTTLVVFGGTGFLGRRLVQRLVAEGLNMRVAVRHAERARSALRAAGLEQVIVFPADVRDQSSVAKALDGANAVVNAVSAYVEKGGVTFQAVHEQGAETIAREAASAGLTRLLLVSGIGADPTSSSPYIRARGRGEVAVRRAFPGATIIRPSVMFGPGDALFSALADLARRLQIVPLIGGGRTRLQPVYVGDVVEAIVRIVDDDSRSARQVYELAGPHVYTLHELTTMVLKLINKPRRLVPVPFIVADVGAWLLELLPNAPLTKGQVDLLKADNVASGLLPGFRELLIEPRSVDQIVPTYIGQPHSPTPT